MNKKISTIGYQVPGKSDSLIDFHSKSSLMDSDILIFSPDTPEEYENQYQGQNSYSETGSFQYKEYTQHWKKELTNLLEAGRTVFLFLKEKKTFYLKTGTKEYRPKMTISHVGLHNNYEFLPVDIGTMTTAKGKSIKFSGDILFNNFYKIFKNDLEYQVYLEDVENAIVIFTGKDKSKILGAIYKVSTGHLVVLPYLNYDEDKFTKYKKNKKGEESAYWTKEAVKFGHTLIDCLIEIDKSLSQKLSKTPPPIWVSNGKFSSKKEVSIQKNIDDNIGKIEKIDLENKKLHSELQEEQILKDLLYEQGKPLENAVIKALEILGFKAENYDDGELELDQVITSPEGYRYIGECEGKNEKDIDITKFRQLLESLNADFAREDVEEKALGILFGNAQRLTEPQNRTLDFTKKCKTGADREKIALVRTIDMFGVVKYLKEKDDKTFQQQCRKAIHDGLGKIVVFPPIPENKEDKNDSK